MTELVGRVMPSDRLRSDYLAIPFEVPPGSRALHVTFTYEDAMSADVRTGGNTIDLGLFGPGSLEFGSPAFRGWSGSERSEVWLTPEGATPGYRPGPIEPGTWHVVLGLYQVAVDGAPYRLTIETDRALPAGIPDFATRVDHGTLSSPDAPAIPGPRWLRGDLHCHTLHSDGADEPATLVAEALRLGLDFLAITDHNTDSHHGHVLAATDEAIVLLKAEEITTYYGHSNAWGLTGWVDFRNRTPAQMRRSFDEVRRQGGLVSVNHPFGGTSPWELGDETAATADTIEVWNGPWSPDERYAIDWWAGLLAGGARPTAVGGSDCHSFRRRKGQSLAGPTTWVKAASRDRDGVVEAIRAGRVVITARPDTPRPDVVAVRQATPDASLGSPVGSPTGVRRVTPAPSLGSPVGVPTGVRRATPAPSLGSLDRAGIGETLGVRRDDTIEVTTALDGDALGLAVRILSDRGLEASGAPRATFRIPAAGRRFLRLELDAVDGSVAALTNPIHLREV